MPGRRRITAASRAALLCVFTVLACGGGVDPPADGGTGPDEDQPPLDTRTRTEADVTWDSGLRAQNIRWNYNLTRPLRTSVSIVGTVRIDWLNASRVDTVVADVLIRLVGGDGFQHVPEVPFRRIGVAPRDTLLLRENFIVEMKDTATANEVERMTISLF